MLFHDLPADLAGVGYDPSWHQASFPILGPYPSVESLVFNFGFIVKNTYIVNVIHTPQNKEMMGEVGVPVCPFYSQKF